MKLTKKIDAKELKNATIEVTDWSEYQDGKTVTFTRTFFDYSPSTDRIKWVKTEKWMDGNKIEQEKKTKGSCFSAKALKRINAGVVFQKTPYPTSKYTVTYRREKA